jgi:hypothetical protein
MLRYRNAGVKGERKYSSYSFFTWTLDVVSGQRHSPAALYPRESTSCSLGQEAGWASEPVWTQRLEEKSFASAEDRTPLVQIVVRQETK